MSQQDIELIRNTTKKIAEKEIPSFQNPENYNRIPIALFQSLCQQGIGTPTLSEEFGGSALNTECTAITYEELAKVDLGVAVFMAVHSMVAGLIQKFASSSLKQHILPELSSGKKLAAFALTEPQAGSDAANLKSKAIKEGTTFKLSGEKCYITSAGFADLYLVFAKTSPNQGKKGISAFLVEADSPGLVVSPPEKKMGAELSPIASLTFNDVTVPEQNLVGQIDQGYSVALGGLAGGRINIAACAVGVASTAFERARSYILERQQFGQKIAMFQGVQFILADMYQKLEAARELTYKAAREIDAAQNLNNSRLSSSVAKCFATDAAMSITTDAVQLFGGAGYIKEFGVEALMRDAKMLQIVEGTNQIQRNVIARELLK